MIGNDKEISSTRESLNFSDSDIFSLSEDSFFSNLSEIEDMRSNLPSVNDEANRKLQAILSINEKLMTTYDLKKSFEIIVEYAIELTQAEKGYLILIDDNSELEIAHMQSSIDNVYSDDLSQVSQTIVNRVIENKQVEIIKNALKDEDCTIRTSIVNLKLKSIMCAPMVVNNEVIGVIYVENRSRPGVFNKESSELLSYFSSQGGIAISNHRLFQLNTEYSLNLKRMVEERTAELNQEKQYVENIIDNIGEILLTVDNSSIIRKVSKAVRKILGFEPEELIGRNINMVYGPICLKKIINAIKADEDKSYLKCQITNKAGKKVSVLVAVSLIKENGRVTGAVLINTDMTEAEKYEREKLERKELESINKIAVTANDQINTPLGVIIGRVTILESLVQNNETIYKNLKIIREQSYRIHSILRTMKNLTKIKIKDYKLDGVDMIDIGNKTGKN